MKEDKCIIMVTDQPYWHRCKRTIQDIRSKGRYWGSLVIITDGSLQVEDNFVKYYNLEFIVRPRIDTDYLLSYYKQHPINNDGRHFTKLFQWHKFYSFDSYFKKWNKLLYIDCGTRILDDLEYIWETFIPGKLVAMDDRHPDLNAKKADWILFEKSSPLFEKLNSEITITDGYFLNYLYLYDSSIILENNETVNIFIQLMNKYPLMKSNEMGIMNIYFTFMLKIWEPMNLIMDDGRFRMDWSERYGNDWTKYVVLKYPCRIGFSDV